MDYAPIDRSWSVINEDDRPFDRFGFYTVAATPEPPAILLVLAVAAVAVDEIFQAMTREEIEKRMDETPAPKKIVNND